MKIYTKVGDTGKTSLANGKKVSKSNSQVEMYGTCDELNSTIGVSISFLKKSSKLEPVLTSIQNTLLELGSELAGFRPKEGTPILLEEDVVFLENQIDTMTEKLLPMKNFILPGGSKAASFLHVSRTVCRRLERLIVKAKENNEEVFDISIQYTNRLSDYLFVAARYANLEEGIEDIKWKSRTR